MSKADSKKISGVAYVAYAADLASRGNGIEGHELAGITFQCACVKGLRTIEQWDALVTATHSARKDDTDIAPAEAVELLDEG